jgi:hypothetical protein
MLIPIGLILLLAMLDGLMNLETPTGINIGVFGLESGKIMPIQAATRVPS